MATTDPARPLSAKGADVATAAVPPRGKLIAWPRGRGAPSDGLLTDAIPFQGDLDELIRESPPSHMRQIHYAATGFLIALIVIAAVVKVDVVVVGRGELTTDAPPIVLQPIERSIIRELKVRPGDIVVKGQVLATLDPTFTQADLATLSVQHASLAAQEARLQAELDGTLYSGGAVAGEGLTATIPEEGSVAAEYNAPDATSYVSPAGDGPEAALQAELYGQRQAEYNSRLHEFDEDINRLQANLETAEDDRGVLRRQLEVAKEVESMRERLLKSQTGSRLSYLDAQNNRMRIERDYLDAENKLTELKHTLESKRAERQGFVDGWRRQLFDDMVKVRAELARVKESLTKAERLHDLVEVVAPQDGVVLDVAMRSVGSVLREAEPLVTIVPSDTALIADIRINSADVGYAKPGDAVVLKVDAYPYQRHGLVEGKLRSVGEASYTPNDPYQQMAVPQQFGRQAPSAFHRGQVELTQSHLYNLPEGAHLIPGMTLTADIKVGTRSVLSYFLNPITRGFDEIIREP